jgi:hypothetical protein
MQAFEAKLTSHIKNGYFEKSISLYYFNARQISVFENPDWKIEYLELDKVSSCVIKPS